MLQHEYSSIFKIRELPWSFPMYPDMEDFNARLHTFDQSSWSQRAKATPQEIANAGFYCAGKLNFLKCLLFKIIKSLHYKTLFQ